VGISRRFSLHRTVKTLNRENKELAKRLAEEKEIKEG